MKIYNTDKILLIFLLIALCANTIQACSMFKITVDGKTMVGCNEDAWRTTSKIWFESAKNSSEYGAAFTGSRQVGSNRTAPQSGMNEVGLTFSRLSAYYPSQENPFPNRIKIANEVDYLSNILHQCATIEEVQNYIVQYNHSLFYDDVFMYIDSSGKYLIVEPYELIEGDDPSYLLSNFCPSITENEKARTLDRFRNGQDFLKTHEINSSLDFSTALSDTMHVCRSRNGDGTLLTSIWNTKEKLVNLYFYHSYETTVQFSLREELAKGDHVIDIPELFPTNNEFERLVNYKTPFNTIELRFALLILAGFLAVFSFLLSVSLFWKTETFSFKPVVLITAINLVLIVYLAVLFTNKYIFYFDAPYKHYSSKLISASSFIPFSLLLVIGPFIFYTVKKLKSNQTRRWIKTILVSNGLVYLVSIVGFAYWGLYTVWS